MVGLLNGICQHAYLTRLSLQGIGKGGDEEGVKALDLAQVIEKTRQVAQEKCELRGGRRMPGVIQFIRRCE